MKPHFGPIRRYQTSEENHNADSVYVARCAGKANARAPVSISMLKQIAGRSGRRNSEYAEGLATTLRNPDVNTLRKALEAPPSALKTPSAGLFPEFEHLEVLTRAPIVEHNAGC